jgi:N-acetylglutamate synthase-like GNAT family acetyltransferase
LKLSTKTFARLANDKNIKLLNYMATIRSARETDATQIRDLIHLVGINPIGLDWKRFVVAVNDQDEMIGCGQLKPHGQEVLELASIAVYPEHRGKGVARAIIEHLLKDSPRPLYLMCESDNGPLYEKFGFQAIPYEEMPRYFQRISRVAGLVTTLAQREERLLIMKLQ